MKQLIIALVVFFLASNVKAQFTTDFKKATDSAKDNKKYILLNFSGSDWCGPCVRMHTEIFGDAKFKQYAFQTLVLVNADFPRKKKNQLSPELQKQNDALAEKYNQAGNFPFTLLLSAEGKIIEAWDGFPKQGVDAFIIAISHAIDDAK